MKQKTIATRHLRTKIAAGYVLILFVICFSRQNNFRCISLRAILTPYIPHRRTALLSLQAGQIPLPYRFNCQLHFYDGHKRPFRIEEKAINSKMLNQKMRGKEIIVSLRTSIKKPGFITSN